MILVSLPPNGKGSGRARAWSSLMVDGDGLWKLPEIMASIHCRLGWRPRRLVPIQVISNGTDDGGAGFAMEGRKA